MKWITTFLLIATCLLSAPVPPLSTAQQVRDHWAFKPVFNPVPPKIDSDWARTRWINLFSDDTEAGMEPSACRSPYAHPAGYHEFNRIDADVCRSATIRGRRFSGCMGKLIDRLLASPHYGERWARHWLDGAILDTRGYRFAVAIESMPMPTPTAIR